MNTSYPKTYYVRNVLKAAEDALRHSETGTVTLRFISGMHGGLIKERQYKQPKRMINQGPWRKVTASFTRSSYTSTIRFECVW